MKLGKTWAFVSAAAVVFAAVLAHHTATRRAAPQALEAELISRADPIDKAIQARSAAKEGIVNDLIAGRTSLLQAAAAFRDLRAQGPPDFVRTSFPEAASEDEAYCRSVIEFVSSHAPAVSRDDLTCALNAELYNRFQDGNAHLSNPAGDSLEPIADAASARRPSSP